MKHTEHVANALVSYVIENLDNAVELDYVFKPTKFHDWWVNAISFKDEKVDVFIMVDERHNTWDVFEYVTGFSLYNGKLPGKFTSLWSLCQILSNRYNGAFDKGNIVRFIEPFLSLVEDGSPIDVKLDNYMLVNGKEYIDIVVIVDDGNHGRMVLEAEAISPSDLTQYGTYVDAYGYESDIMVSLSFPSGRCKFALGQIVDVDNNVAKKITNLLICSIHEDMLNNEKAIFEDSVSNLLMRIS